jgi:hypothetical protein
MVFTAVKIQNTKLLENLKGRDPAEDLDVDVQCYNRS